MAASRGKKKQNQRRSRAQAKPQHTGSEGTFSQTAGHDIVGVLIATVAIAMVVSLVSPSSAPVTHAMGQFLVQGFGRGAMLVPVALGAFVVTYFMDTDEPVTARVAIGLTLIVVAVLAIMSISVPVAAGDSSALFVPDTLAVTGGYVGAGLAWCLLVSVGHDVGLVVLVALIVTGAVICGLSISRITSAIQQKARDAREDLAARAASNIPEQPDPVPAGPVLFDENGEPATTFIGSRKTSVLRRGRGSEDEEQKTKLLRRRHPRLDVDGVEPAHEIDDAAEVTETGEDAAAVPPFLADDAGQAEPKTKKKASKRTPKAKAGAPSGSSRPGEGSEDFKLPSLSLLDSNPKSASSSASSAELNATAAKLQATLSEFGLTSQVVGHVSGPLVTTFKVEMGEGERVSKITNLQDDIALALAAVSVRIFAPIPGTSLVGIEIPNKERSNVFLGDVLPYAKGGPLEFAIGRDSEGKPVVADLSRMPHLLVAGTTGSGKSVMLNSLIMSILMRATPDQVRFIFVDPKRVEFHFYDGLPHLYVPVVTEPRQAASALQWAVSEMERRLKVFERAGARDIRGYNKMVEGGKFADQENPPTALPYLVVVIDELSDLMMVAGKDVEASIVRIAQLARAAGIHLVLATQRPTANVVTGLIKSNIETRIALSVSSGVDSRVILDQVGAERLLGHGDMLYRYGGNRVRRILGCYTSDPEIEKTIDFWRGQAEPDYHDEILSTVVPASQGGGSAGAADDDDPLIWEAAQIVVDSKMGAASTLQRQLKVGYARAGRIIDMLEQKGVVGPRNGNKPREVLLDAEGLEELKAADAAYREV